MYVLWRQGGLRPSEALFGIPAPVLLAWEVELMLAGLRGEGGEKAPAEDLIQAEF